MDKIKFDWPNILEMSCKFGLPQHKKRAIIREYLQCQLLKMIYSQKRSNQLSFIGGTSLRLLHNLDRFSEDLDFDNLALTSEQLNEILDKAVKGLNQAGFVSQFKFKLTRADVWRGWLKFEAGMLHQIGISGHTQEKLLIKVEIMRPDFSPKLQTVVLNRFGVLENIVSYDQSVILAQKSLAVWHRQPARARDFYDVIWLISRGIRPHLEVFEKDKINTVDDYQKRMIARYRQIKPQLGMLKKQLQPFLINEDNIRNLDFFEEVMVRAGAK